jgi:ABC-type uncharacterized transport system substrate-binding protein
MQNTIKAKEQTVTLAIDTTELKAHQVRILKTINALAQALMTTDNEEDFFEGTTELVKAIANAAKKSNFTEIYSKGEAIQYAEQAIEYAVDHLGDDLQQGSFVRFDN